MVAGWSFSTQRSKDFMTGIPIQGKQRKQQTLPVAMRATQ
jgi:hypothetical protein